MTNQTMEDQDMLRDSARRFFGESAPVSQLRQLRDTRDETGFSTALWSEFGKMGYSGIMVAEEFGGSGLGVRAAALLMEQMGHTLCAAPFLASSIVAVTALQHAGSADQKAQWLPLLAHGSAIATLGLDEGRKHRPEHIDARAVRDGEGWRLNGTKCFVPDGHVANLLIVAARTSGASRDERGVTLFLVPRETAGVQVERTIMVDSHNAARVHFDNVQLPSNALLGPVDGAAVALNATLNAARAASAAELLGIAEEVFKRTIAYLKDRRQFDRQIGEFQALQHRAAKLYVDIELSRAALHEALCQLESASGTAASRAVAVAKAKCGNTATLAVQEGIQMHGGMGMTDECEIGFYVKRVRVLQELFGDADYHMSRIACLDGF